MPILAAGTPPTVPRTGLDFVVPELGNSELGAGRVQKKRGIGIEHAAGVRLYGWNDWTKVSWSSCTIW